MKDTSPLKIIVPVSMEAGKSEKEKLLSLLRELHEKYRFTLFGLHFPGKGWRSSPEAPSEAYFLKNAKLFREICDELAPEGIHCGWWNTLTVKTASVPAWQKIVRANGEPYGFASCPLDPEYRRWLVDSMAFFAKEGKPEFIMTEDDYGLHGGCFCERHLAEFSRREGRTWTREDLVHAMGDDSPEARALHQRWCRLKRDTLSDFAADIRAAVDVETPEIPIGTCQSGSWGGDGDATEAVTRAFAGSKHRPFSRLYGTFYAGEDIPNIPERLLHPLYYKQYLPDDFICLHESDTYPHTRFYSSAATMRIMMSTVYSQGFDGSVFQAGYLHKDRAYAKMHSQELDRFQAMHDASKRCTVRGVNLPYVPGFYLPSDWTRCVSHFGIPYTTIEAPVTFLSGKLVYHLSDEILNNLFKKGLFLDGDAADALQKRGFGELMGCDVGPNAVSGVEKFDLEGYEQIMDGFLPGNPDRTVPRAGTYSPGGDGNSFDLIPHDGAEIITKILTWKKRELGVGMIRFVNRLGGRIVVMGMGTAGNFSSALFHYQRQKLIQEELVWCGADVVFVKNEPRVFVVMNEANEPADAGFSGMLTITNLNPDELDGLTLHLPAAWRKTGTLKRLDQHGTWQTQPFEKTPDGIRIPAVFEYARPQSFLFGC